jgi:hypothetical protein
MFDVPSLQCMNDFGGANFMRKVYASAFSSRSYSTTDSQSVRVSWCQAPVYGPSLNFISVIQLRICRCIL